MILGEALEGGLFLWSEVLAAGGGGVYTTEGCWRMTASWTREYHL